MQLLNCASVQYMLPLQPARLVSQAQLYEQALCSLLNLFELRLLQVKGQRRITFDQFVNALGIIAEKKGQSLKDVIQPILQAGGPSVTGTKAGYVKFHDDKVGDPTYVPHFWGTLAMLFVCIW